SSAGPSHPLIGAENVSEANSWSFSSVKTAGSVRLDVGGLDHRPPFFDFGLLISAERLRRQLLARRDFNSLGFEFLPHTGVGQNADGGGVELGDDVLRRTLRREDRRPQRE